MWNPAGEIPQIVLLHIGDKTLAARINGCDPGRSVEHDRPLICGMPVQFTNTSGSESHVHAGQRLRDGEFPNRHLTRPSALVCSLVRERKWIFEVLNQALRIRTGWPCGIRILFVQGVIEGTWIGCAPVSWVWVLLCHGAYRQTASRRQGSGTESK